MWLALRTLRRMAGTGQGVHSQLAKAILVAVLVLMMFLASLTEAAIWGLAFFNAGTFETFEPAFYFSMVTLTTLGYGDVVVGEQWRLVASFEAANGTIMFGWTAALIVAFVQRVYFGAKVSEES